MKLSGNKKEGLNTCEKGVQVKSGPKFLLGALLTILTVALLISVIVLSCVPPVSKDALVHHLAVPKLYLRYGGAFELPTMGFSYYPMNLDLLYMIPLYFGSDIVPKFIHFSFALLTAWLIYAYIRRWADPVYALFGAAFFLSIPIIVKLSITAYVDLGLIFFSTASLFFVLRWLENGFQAKSLVVSAIFCGLAMGTKYNGLIVFLLITFFVTFIYSRYGRGEGVFSLKSIGYGLLFVVLALLIFSPWPIRNYLWTNNPIYPLYDHWFNLHNGAPRHFLGIFTVRSRFYGESWWEIALLPVRIFFQGKDGNPQYFDGKLNPLLFILPFFAFKRINGDSKDLQVQKKVLIAFAVLYFAFAFFGTSLRIRYISPIIPPLVVLSVFGIRTLVTFFGNMNSMRRRALGMSLILLIASSSLGFNAAYIFKEFQKVRPFEFLSGKVSRDEFIERFRAEYPAMRFINKNLPPNAKVLFLHIGNRGYYCDRSYVLDVFHGASIIGGLAKGSPDPEAILRGLDGRAVTHLLIRFDLFKRWVQTNLTPRDQIVLADFFRKYTTLLFFKGGYGVCRLG